MKTLKNGIIIAYLALVVRSVIYGLSFLFTGHLLAQNTNVFDILALRFLLSAVVFTLLVVTGLVKVNYKHKKLLPLLLVMMFEPIGYFIFETFGLTGTTTSVAGILTSLQPALTIVFEWLILRETTTKSQKFLIFLRILGGLIIILNATSSGVNTPVGIVFMLLSVLSGVFFIILSRKASKDFTPIEITYAMTIFGAVVFNAISVIRHLYLGNISTYFVPYTDPSNIVGFIFLSIISSIFATILNNYGLSKIQASSASAIAGLATVVSVVAGAVFNHETMYWYHYVSTALIIIASVGVGVIGEKRKKKEIDKPEISA